MKRTLYYLTPSSIEGSTFFERNVEEILIGGFFRQESVVFKPKTEPYFLVEETPDQTIVTLVTSSHDEAETFFGPKQPTELLVQVLRHLLRDKIPKNISRFGLIVLDSGQFSDALHQAALNAIKEGGHD